METADVLRRTSLFGRLTSEELDRVVPLCRRERYQKGFLIACEGGEAKELYIIEEGCLALEMTVRWGPGGTSWQWPVDVATVGEPVAWSALVEPHTLTASIRPLVPTSVLAIEGAALTSLFDECPRIGRAVLEGVATLVSSRLRGARRTAAQSVAIFSHDLRTPLAAVQYFNQVILGDNAGPINTEQREMLERNSQRIEKLLALLDDLLEAAHIDNGLLAPHFGTVPVSPIIAGAVDRIAAGASAKGIAVSVTLASDLGEIRAAPQSLEQAVYHLLDNAIKFTPGGGTVHVEAAVGEESVRIVVTDTGIGVAPSEQVLIFGDCYRGQDCDVNSEGTGMGLPIARRIVEAHGGRVQVESPPSGLETGSRFVFTLPRLAAPQWALKAYETRSGRATGRVPGQVEVDHG